VLLNTGLSAIMADQVGLLAHVRRDLTAAINDGRFDITDVDLALHFDAGSMLGLFALLDADPELDADALADQHAVRVLRGFGLSKPEAERLVSRPLPHLTDPA
jgi:hypothetical protein